MLPIVFEWHWDSGHIIFMGLLYMVLTLVGVGLLTALLMTLRNTQDMASGNGHGHDVHGAEAASEEH